MTEGPRFLTPADVAEVLNTSVPQVMALIRDGELSYLRIGGRGVFRIEVVDVEDYIARQKRKAKEEVRARRAKLSSSEATPESRTP